MNITQHFNPLLRNTMTPEYAILYALRNGRCVKYKVLADKVAKLLGIPKESVRQGNKGPYFTWSNILTTCLRDEKGFAENSQINRKLKNGYWKITQAGIDYLRRNPEP